ncbi:MAG: enoyl-CoA hydratase-related protein [Candidatus Sericytochromatia bacterium]|nr:enoyl-CoA hydratase-related protein [Candidatus Sericytochromatia bacterium]
MDVMHRLEREDHVATLTLDRPEAANALCFPMLLHLRAELEALRHDRDLRVLVVTGAGSKAFCAGADLKERAGMSPDQVRRFLVEIRGLMDDVAAMPCPVVAALNGLALGGGTELALAADIRIAADHALMGLTETGLGIIPGAGGTQRLPRLIGLPRAKEMIFTARRVAMDEALAIGLVQQVVPAAELAAAVAAMVARIAANAPRAVEMAKWAMDRGADTDMRTGLELEERAYATIIPTRDRLEGLAAFREKRPPVYTGE